jgi:hypothetical protein
MNKFHTITKWLAVLLLLSACSQKTTEQKYAAYINDPENKIVQKIKIGKVEARMKWISPDYHQLISRNRDRVIDDGLCYFNAKFENNTAEKPVKEKIIYLDFDMQNDFVLLSGNDSIMPAICQKIENGISGSYEYMLAFEKPPGGDNKIFSVIYKDKMFGMGTVEFVYDQDDIKKIPKLKRDKPE